MHTNLFAKLHARYASLANPKYAQQQQAYMKSSMPFWGIPKPQVDRIAKDLFAQHPPRTQQEYRQTKDPNIWHNYTT